MANWMAGRKECDSASSAIDYKEISAVHVLFRENMHLEKPKELSPHTNLGGSVKLSENLVERKKI